MKTKITNLLLEFGIPAHIKGYRYLQDAISLVIANQELMGNVTSQLYPQIADKHNTTPSRVERAIRHAIFIAWSKSSLELKQKIFRFVSYSDVKVTNSHFIATLAETLQQSGKPVTVEVDYDELRTAVNPNITIEMINDKLDRLMIHFGMNIERGCNNGALS